MHDVVSHQVSLIAPQAGALRVTADAPATREIAATIRTLATRTLDELRVMAGVLRSGHAADLVPQPRLDDVPNSSTIAACPPASTAICHPGRTGLMPCGAPPTALSRKASPTPASTPPRRSPSTSGARGASLAVHIHNHPPHPGHVHYRPIPQGPAPAGTGSSACANEPNSSAGTSAPLRPRAGASTRTSRLASAHSSTTPRSASAKRRPERVVAHRMIAVRMERGAL